MADILLNSTDKSGKELSLEKSLLSKIEGPAKLAAEYLMDDEEVQAMQNYANTVSIKRLHFNDHGPVHMKKVAINAVRMMGLLKSGGVTMNLEEEGMGTYEDSLTAVVMAALLHDVGMTVGRDDHEHTAVFLAYSVIDRALKHVYPDDIHKRVVVRSMAIEGIVGHMAHQKIHSREAGVILIADGCDMEKGRARIPMMLNTQSQVGDIHKYSASAIERVRITKGEEKPIRLYIEMNASVGFFQVEEVLLRKVQWSTIQDQIELYAGVIDREVKRYI